MPANELPEVPKTTNYVVRNETPDRLTVPAQKAYLELAPLEEYRVDEKEYKDLDLTSLKSSRRIEVTSQADANSQEVIMPALLVSAVVYYFACNYFTRDNPENPNDPIAGPWFWLAGAGAVVFFLACLATYLSGNWRVAKALFVQILALLASIGLGIGLPFCAIYFFGEGKTLLAGPNRLELLGRILQFTLIVVASLAPALAFFLFDRYQLGTLRNRFYHDIFRLDPTVRRMCDVRAKYGKRIDEIFGEETATGSRIARGTRWPILVCTVVLLLCWVLTLLPAGPLKISNPSEILSLFVPQRKLFIYGFLGAYVFALGTVVRRYSRRDLKPRAYTHITVRILTVFVLSWVLEILAASEEPGFIWFLAAFVIGILPETFFALARETVVSGALGWAFTSLREKHPLSNIVGIDLYDRARLLEEGVANVESLAHCDLVDLIVETRVPVPQIVDWVDQAILYLHATPETDDDEQKPTATALQRLSEYGIRTATDLERAFSAHMMRNADEGSFFAMLPADQVAAIAPIPPPRLRVILDAIEDDEWLGYIRYWRETGQVHMRGDAFGKQVVHFHAQPTPEPAVG